MTNYPDRDLTNVPVKTGYINLVQTRNGILTDGIGNSIDNIVVSNIQSGSVLNPVDLRNGINIPNRYPVSYFSGSSSFEIDGTISLQRITLMSNSTFSTVNLLPGYLVILRIDGDNITRSISLPNWQWTNDIPTSVSANKSLIVSMMIWGLTDDSVIASSSETI